MTIRSRGHNTVRRLPCLSKGCGFLLLPRLHEDGQNRLVAVATRQLKRISSFLIVQNDAHTSMVIYYKTSHIPTSDQIWSNQRSTWFTLVYALILLFTIHYWLKSMRCCCVTKSTFIEVWTRAAEHLIVLSLQAEWVTRLRSTVVIVPSVCGSYLQRLFKRLVQYACFIKSRWLGFPQED